MRPLYTAAAVYLTSMNLRYKNHLRPLLSPAERRVFKKLSTPERVQDYLEALPHNFSKKAGETCRSVRQILRKRRAYCFEGALFAAAALAYHGKPLLLMDLQTTNDDEDHVVALFSVQDRSASGGKERKLWGALSKTNNPVLRWRDPVYTSVRELAMSYFHEYFLYKDGRKTLRAYSRPFDLTKYKPEVWVTGEGSLDFIAEALDASPHFPILPRNKIVRLRNATVIERKVLDLEEWKK